MVPKQFVMFANATFHSDSSVPIFMGNKNSISNAIQYRRFTNNIFLEMSNNITTNNILPQYTQMTTQAAHLHNWMH